MLKKWFQYLVFLILLFIITICFAYFFTKIILVVKLSLLEIGMLSCYIFLMSIVLTIFFIIFFKKINIYKFFSVFVLGSKLETSISKSLDKIKEREIPNTEDISKIIDAIITKLFTNSILKLLIISLPAVITILILISQNRILNIQNDKIQTQIYLEEANRRANLGFELTEILNQVSANKDSITVLSKTLIGRIISLTRVIKPYRHLDDYGELTNEIISPERGQIFRTLIQSNISREGLDILLERSNFDYSDLAFTEFNDKVITNAFFTNCKMDHAKFANYVQKRGAFNNCTLLNADFGSSFLTKVSFNKSDLSNSSFIDVYLPQSNGFRVTSLTGIDLNACLVPQKDWLEKLSEYQDEIEGIEEFLKKHKVDTTLVFNNRFDNLDKKKYYLLDKVHIQ